MNISNRILAFSSSRTGNFGYLEWNIQFIKNFLPCSKAKVAFVPFAIASNEYESYAAKVSEALKTLDCEIIPVFPQNAQQTIRDSDMIMVGGGNTFKLLHDLYEYGLVDLIRKEVNDGKPYVGWSAGSNILGMTISTSNDMAIMLPKSLNALQLLPFQINPHYYNHTIPGFNGETRDERLREFLQVYPDGHIICLPEGSVLVLKTDHLFFHGETDGVHFYFNQKDKNLQKQDIYSPNDLSQLFFTLQ